MTTIVSAMRQPRRALGGALLAGAVSDAETGGDTQVTVWRKDREENLNVRVGKVPARQMALAKTTVEVVELPVLGLTIAEVDDETRARLGLDDSAREVVLTQVDRDAKAAEKGLRRGDLITHVNQKHVSSSREVVRAVEKARGADRRSVLLASSARVANSSWPSRSSRTDRRDDGPSRAFGGARL